MNHRKLLSGAIICCSIALLALIFIPGALQSSPSAGSPNRAADRAQAAAQSALSRLQAVAPTRISTSVSEKTGRYDFVRAAAGGVLVRDDAAVDAKTRARSFLADYGDLVGLSETERSATREGGAPAAGSDLQVFAAETDDLGISHVRLNQSYQGLRVFGAQLIVHMNGTGITALNGEFVPNISLNTQPGLTGDTAAQAALAVARKGAENPNSLQSAKPELAVYAIGLLEGHPVEPRLAYAVEVTGETSAEQIWIDAENGRVLARIPLHETALYRTIYSPMYDPNNPDLFVQRKEGDPPHPTPFVNNLYDFAGQTYNFYASAFGRDSYDGMGKHMVSVYLINQQCPNAYWNGTSTNYCPAFDADDVVSHEWSHAYTEYTHGLIYAYQSGALNESYSDIFGESVDLINGVDGIGGSNNTQPYPNGQRWLVGEDLGEQAQDLLLRDMYDPDRQGDPGKVSSPNYACGNDDGGGVHTNSGVPNHAYAMVVDGTQFYDGNVYNGQTITGIGLTKAAAIYFRAEKTYQTPTTTFAQHATALQMSCSDLIGAPLKDPTTMSATGAASSAVINANDCEQVAKAMLAVEMSITPPCNTGYVLRPEPAPLCGGANVIFSEDWEVGGDAGAAQRGWTKTSMGYATGAVDWEDDRNPAVTGPHTIRDFKVRGSLPDGRPGSAAFATDPPVGQPGGGTCQPGGDYSGSFTLDSPSIAIPANSNAPLLVFDHWIASEAGVDGGQVEVSVNGGSYQLLTNSAYTYNPPNNSYNDAAPIGNNTGPNPNEAAWSGFNIGVPNVGSWGTTVLNLASVAQPGDTIKIRFTWSQDGCNGIVGWFIDNVRVVSCPVLAAPTLTTGPDYENPDTNGQFTMLWTRPPGAAGPDVLQESKTSCAPLVNDDAEHGLTNWTVSTSGTGALNWKTDNTKPNHPSNTFNVQGVNAVTNAHSYLTYNSPITIPAGGQTFLNFLDWDDNEGDDNVIVEVSEDNGANWNPVYIHSRSDIGTAAAAFATEPLFSRSVNLASYGGKTIRLRFHYSLGPDDRAGTAPLGWYVDNIAIVNDDWVDVAATPLTSVVQNKPSGTYCYRVRTTYLLSGERVPGPFSNVVTVTVAEGIPAVVSRKMHGGTRDIQMPFVGMPGVECRRAGSNPNGNHTIVFEFGQPVTFASAGVIPAPNATAEVENTSISGNEVSVALRNVSDAQTLYVQLNGVNFGSTTRSYSIPVSILLGDVNGDGAVNAADATIMRNHSGEIIDVTNYRTDVNADGTVNSADATIIRAHSGSGL